jgi:hypothetical protein
MAIAPERRAARQVMFAASGFAINLRHFTAASAVLLFERLP